MQLKNSANNTCVPKRYKFYVYFNCIIYYDSVIVSLVDVACGWCGENV